ncbi:hypothetical protein [Moorena sp. SIO3I6]|uniref:hypothetical protein n=1 Tax=Moorena sp. SIO3I6 TaxID=2607831 RepID=UPI0013F933C1|nr:hypothetical protein [Moorena sp. SIO3I6]NEP26904.1 hypothetical protein [Moorena sp. SIO3I6]
MGIGKRQDARGKRQILIKYLGIFKNTKQSSKLFHSAPYSLLPTPSYVHKSNTNAIYN